MSSAVLYLAIVAVWGVVLVPMWLRRDGDGIGRLLHRRGEPLATDDLAYEEPDAADESVPEADVPPSHQESAAPVASGEPEAPAVRRRRATRGAVIARRRRRTLGLSLLTLTAIVVTASHAAPWWFTVPPAVLLAGHLSLLRVAVRMDQARREEMRRRAAAARAEAARRAREEQRAREVEAARTAEVIELPAWAQEEVYDQYTDRRAVGD
ncbi:hypothetical protein GCM10023191_012070 [Actinoallomurus oryzae]|uniref:Uncharacterized protein n=1 Tax=Actinoallomurus oryzae TaxID=502180 RepID=A0ABP8PG59_9ACTN